MIGGLLKDKMVEKIDIAIRTLKELQLCNKEQDVITSIDDSNIILQIVVNEVMKFIKNENKIQ